MSMNVDQILIKKLETRHLCFPGSIKSGAVTHKAVSRFLPPDLKVFTATSDEN